MGLVVLVLNIPLFILGAVFLGNSFGIKSLYGAFVFSVFLDLTAGFKPISDNMLLCAIFGGILLGIGFGAIFLSGATTGGTDILAALGNKAIRAIDIGKWFFIIDTLIIISGIAFIKNTESLLSGIIALMISSFVLDYIISGANTAKLVYVISDSSEEIAQEILNSLSRGVTGIKIKGMYTKSDRTMLMCAVKKFELQKLENIALKHDKNAFIILTGAHQITGEGFMSYPEKTAKNKKTKDK
jgi:uncharacterized membrane-anchored protein YitT (DUF2179 family)